MTPTEYPSVLPAAPDGYRAALGAAALFDVSATAKLRLTGPDAARFVHNISTNTVKDLPAGGGCELFFCDSRAKALFLARAYRTASGLLLDTAPGRGDALVKHLDKFLIAENVELEDVTADFAQFHIAGPAARDVLTAATAQPMPDPAEFQHLERMVGPTPVSVRRYDPLGVPGFDVVCPADRAEDVRRALVAAGALPAGADAYEVLRVEAGTPLYGPDIDDNRFVMEVGRAGRAVSYAKGCFPGQEPIVMARDRAGRVNRQFVGLRVLTGGPLPPGTKLTRDGREVGLVTSGVVSPRLGGPLALGYVHWQSADPGTRLDGPAPVEVIGYPPLG